MAMTCAQGLALVRMGMGLTFLMSAFAKTQGGWFSGETEMLNGFVQKNLDSAVPPYADFLGGTVVPYAPLFAPLIVLGEWVAGISLAFGLLTRLGAFVGIWLTANYLFAKGLMTPEATDDRIFVLAGAVIAVLAAQIAWSLDRALADRLRTNPVTRWLTGLSSPRERWITALERRDAERRRAA